MGVIIMASVGGPPVSLWCGGDQWFMTGRFGELFTPGEGRATSVWEYRRNGYQGHERWFDRNGFPRDADEVRER